MNRIGIREARQRLSALLERVQKGQAFLITDRGRPVARLIPAEIEAGKPFRGRARGRTRLPEGSPPLSVALAEDREDRL